MPHLTRTASNEPVASTLRDLHRRASDYSLASYFPVDACFTASDAISLAMLVRSHEEGSPEVRAYYRQSFDAVVRALGLREADRLLVDSMSPESFSGPAIALLQVLRLRGGLIAFQDEWGDMLEGDRWGLRQKLPPPAHEAMLATRKWFHATADQLLGDVNRLDLVICQLLGWEPPGAFVRYSELRERFGYPDVEQASDDLFSL